MSFRSGPSDRPTPVGGVGVDKGRPEGRSVLPDGADAESPAGRLGSLMLRTGQRLSASVTSCDRESLTASSTPGLMEITPTGRKRGVSHPPATSQCRRAGVFVWTV